MTERSGRSVADTLIELLEKVPDVSTLELLLEPPHLAKLLRAHGWTDEQVRHDLTEGARPAGELLLAVLAKQPDPAQLLDLLGNPAPSVARRKTPAAAAAGASPTARRSRAQAVAAILFGALLAAPSGWFLFVKLDFLHVPGLMFHFKGAYTLLFSALVGGLLLMGRGIRDLRRS